MARKFDGMIEAVRYGTDGRVDMVRIYERRGATFSDYLLLSRAELVRRLKAGQRFVAGQRVVRMASTFTVKAEVKLAGDALMTSLAAAGVRDDLSGVPLF